MRHISKSFGATPALDDVDFTAAAGEAHALVGENGAGKSTLMKILAGAVQPDAGAMELSGRPFHPRDPSDARRSGIAMIYQELSLAPDMTVEENIMLGIEPNIAGVLKPKSIRQKACAALKPFAHPEIVPWMKINRLAPAARQMVEIARALAAGCKILVLDEPTSSLAAGDVDRLFDILRELKKCGIAIIYISHFLEEIRRIADAITVLRDGKVTAARLPGGSPDSELIGCMVGRRIDTLYPRSRRRHGELLLEINGLCGRDRPDAASLRLHAGQVLGIAGLIGSGRTELLRCIFGLEKIRRGGIQPGMFSGPAAPHRRWRQGMGFLSENRKEEGIAAGLSVADNMVLSNLRACGRCGAVWPRRQQSRARRWIKSLNIKCNSPRQPAGKLSGGNQQKTALARLLEHDVDILLLDEPTRGIDVAAKAEIYRLIDELACRGKAILIVSSYLPELLGICDQIAVMRKGRLGPARDAAAINEHSLMAEAIGSA